MTSKDWPLWAAAIRKEVIGLVAAGLWDEVPRSSVPENVRVNTGHLVFKVKTEHGKFLKAKARFVFDGHKSVYEVDYRETTSNMAAMKSVRTVCALAAPRDWKLCAFDISQAFTVSHGSADALRDPMTVRIGWLHMLIATTVVVRTRGEVPRV